MNRLREIREKKKMSLIDLEKKSGISRQTIYRLECEEDETARIKTLRALAKALDVKVTDFFDE